MASLSEDSDLDIATVTVVAETERLEFISDVEAVLYDAEAIGINTKIVIHNDVIPLCDRIKNLIVSSWCTIM